MPKGQFAVLLILMLMRVKQVAKGQTVVTYMFVS